MKHSKLTNTRKSIRSKMELGQIGTKRVVCPWVALNENKETKTKTNKTKKLEFVWKVHVLTSVCKF